MGTEKRQRQKANRQLRYEQEVKAERRRSRTRRIVIGIIAVVGGLALVLALAWLFGRDDDDSPNPATTVPIDTSATTPSASAPPSTTTPATSTPASVAPFAYGAGPCPPADVAEPVRIFEAAPQLCIDPAAAYTARFVTDRGDVVVELDAARSPGTVNNFVTLARYGYYDDTLLFRTNNTIDIIQGGGRSNTDSPGYEIPDEGIGYTYEAGELAMARTQAPNSAGGQWFFIVTDKGLDTLGSAGTYVPFGQVTEGLDVLTEILALAGADGDTPTEDVVLEQVEITES